MAEQKKSKGLRRSRHEWQTLLAKLDASGLCVAPFCRREGISTASLYRWRNRLGDRSNGSDYNETTLSQRAPAFLDLGPLKSATASAPRIDLKLDLGNGLTVHLVSH